MEIYQERQTGLASGATEIMDAAAVKSWAAIDTDLDDTVITSIIVAAREMVENFISKDLVSKNRELFVDELEYDGETYIISLPYNAKTGTIVVTSGTTTLTLNTNYEIIGIGGRYIKFTGNHKNVKVVYESDPIASASEVELAKSAVKVLIEQVYDNRANLEGDSDIVVMDGNTKKMLAPLKSIYM